MHMNAVLFMVVYMEDQCNPSGGAFAGNTLGQQGILEYLQ